MQKEYFDKVAEYGQLIVISGPSGVGKRTIIKEYLKEIAEILSWNIWQMDGLKMVIPGSCERNAQPITDLFGEVLESAECPACKSGEMYGHIGTKCLIRDWRIKDREKQKIPFVQLIRK